MGVRWLGWTGMLACLRSPAYPIHVATDTCSLDQSFLISVNGFQLDIASGSSGGTCFAPPARYNPATAGRGVVGHSLQSAGQHSGQGAVSAHGRIRVHSPPPFPLRPRPAGPTLFPPISCPAVLWLLGWAGLPPRNATGIPRCSRHFPFLLAGGVWTVRLHSRGVPVVKQTCHWHVCTCPDGCSSLRTISARVVQGCQWHACFPPSST